MRPTPANRHRVKISRKSPLFRRFAVEVFVVGLGLGPGMVDDAVPVIRRRIKRVEFQGSVARAEMKARAFPFLEGCRGAMGIAGVAHRDQSQAPRDSFSPRPVDGHSVRTAI